MAVQGSLESFGISEIFQLISQQGKTGTVVIETEEATARVRFLEGKLVEAWSDKRAPSEYIGAMLIRAGLVTPGQVEHALELQRESLRPLGDILNRIGAVRVAEFQEILSLQHRETVYHLLGQKRGQFSFRPEPVELEEDVSVPMDVGTLLMEGFRQIDEWPRLRAAIPSDSKVLARQGELTGVMSPEEARVWDLVDGVSTIRQIVDRSRLGDFGGYEALARLLQAGVVAPFKAAPKAAPSPARRKAAVSRGLDGLIGALVVAAAIVLSLVTVEWGGLSGVASALGMAHQEAGAVAERTQNWNQGRGLGPAGR